MKSLILLIALLMAGSFSSSAQNDGSALSSANHPVSSSTTFAIDKNILLVEISNLVDTYILEYAPYPNYGGFPNAWSPHFWTIKMFMAEGTDITSLNPIITLAPGAEITSKHSSVQDFSRQVEYTIICEDGSTVTYLFSAYTQDDSRGSGILFIESNPSWGGVTNPSGSRPYDDSLPFSCIAYPSLDHSFDRWYINGSASVTTEIFNGKIPMISGIGTLMAIFYPKSQVFYTVAVQSEDTNKGTVSGGGLVAAGGSVYVSASPKPGYEFEGWYLNGFRVSMFETFNYNPSASCILIAKFKALTVISGITPICSGSQYSFSASNWVSGTYTWAKSSNLNWGTNNDITKTPIDVKANGSGVGWVRVMSGSTIKAEYPVWVGKPSFLLGQDDFQYIFNAPFLFTVNYASGSNYQLQGVTKADWFNDGPITYNQTSVTIGKGKVGRQEAYVTFWVDVYNTCGYETGVGSLFIVNSRGMSTGIQVYPNPVSVILTIEIDIEAIAQSKALEQTTTEAKLLKYDSTFDIRLYDGQGNLLRQSSAKGGTIQFNVSNLLDAIYYLHIYDGANSTPEIPQIMVEH